MKPQIFSLSLPLMLLLTAELYAKEAVANESQHWVCETEALYRELLAARLYGVGSDPAEGCRKLPVGVPLEQLACETTDFELCQYRWEGMDSPSNYWGSPIIMPPTLETTK